MTGIVGLQESKSTEIRTTVIHIYSASKVLCSHSNITLMLLLEVQEDTVDDLSATVYHAIYLQNLELQ